MKCSSCNKLIPDNEPYFSGHVVPECDENGKRSFGVSPYTYYCQKCTASLPTFLPNLKMLNEYKTTN